MKRYQLYRKSKLPEVGKIPAYWKETRAKYFFRGVYERSETGSEELLSVSHITGVTPRKKSVTMFMADSYEGYKICQVGDLVINIMCSWMGALGVSRYSGIISSAYEVYRPRNNAYFEPSYLDYLLRTPEYIAEYNRQSKGIHSSRLRMYSDDFFQIPIICPPLQEQKQIVDFLDRKLLQIEQFIRNKQKLIDLLKEQKPTLVDNVVTKGINSNVPMKDSGIHSLGKIPSHWKLIPLKYVANLQTGVTLGKSYKNIALEVYPYLRVANVQEGYLDLSDTKTMELPPDEACRYLLKPGDVLITEGGDFDKLGRGYVWEGQIEKCLHQNHIFCIRPNTALLNPYFLTYLMQSSYGRKYFISNSKQTTNLASTNSTILKNLKILLPSIDEQAEILSFINRQLTSFEQATAKAQCEIELIQEYRNALISNAVTGKIDIHD